MANLSTKPLRQHRSPAYPTKLDVMKDSSFLGTNVWARWLNCQAVAGVLVLSLAAGVAGCADDDRTTDCSGLEMVDVFAPTLDQWDTLLTPGPTFPLDYLSEDYALEVVAQELQKHGISMPERDVELESVVIEGVVDKYTAYDWISGKQGVRNVRVSAPLVLDLWFPGDCVGIEYVSGGESSRLGGRDPVRCLHPVKVAAANLGQRIRAEAPNIYVGVFAAPATSSFVSRITADQGGVDDEAGQSLESLQQLWQDTAEDDLRQQIAEFIEWLKGQGVI